MFRSSFKHRKSAQVSLFALVMMAILLVGVQAQHQFFLMVTRSQGLVRSQTDQEADRLDAIHVVRATQTPGEGEMPMRALTLTWRWRQARGTYSLSDLVDTRFRGLDQGPKPIGLWVEVGGQVLLIKGYGRKR